MTADDDLTHPPRRTQSCPRRQAAGLFPHRRCAAIAENLDHLSRRRRLRHDQVGSRCARLCARAHAGDLRCRRRKPKRADRDRTGPRSGNTARRRRRPGHRELGRGGSIFVAARFYAARRQRHAEPARARTGARQHAPLGLPLSAGRCRRQPRRGLTGRSRRRELCHRRARRERPAQARRDDVGESAPRAGRDRARHARRLSPASSRCASN